MHDAETLQDLLSEQLTASLQRWPGDIRRASLDFRQSTLDLLKGFLTVKLSEANQEGVVSTIALILDLHPNHGFIAECIAYAANLHTLNAGVSQTEIGARYGVDKATANKWVGIVRRELNLSQARGMRSDDAVEAYTERAHRVHGTERPETEDKPIKIESLEAIVARLCRWLASIQVATLPEEERAAIARIFSPLKPFLSSLETASRVA